MQLALIDEENCVGCARCLAACPVDAIVGSLHFTHTVIAQECIGCELCLPPCPMDCISVLPVANTNKHEKANQAKKRYQKRQKRLAKKALSQLPSPESPEEKKKIKQSILEAVIRVNHKKND